MNFESETPENTGPLDLTGSEKDLVIQNMKRVHFEQEEYIEKLEHQVIKMNDWDEKSENEII